MLDRISPFPGTWGRKITLGICFVMTSDFATHAIESLAARNTAASIWWVLATAAGCFLLGEKALFK
jgi:hypothetical protein